MTTMTHEEWKAEGTRRFGADLMLWRFVCPSCGHVASVQDWKDAGASEGEVAFSCVGRRSADKKATAAAAFEKKGGPCNYAGGGLFRINPVKVIVEGDKEPHSVFEFAEPTGSPS